MTSTEKKQVYSEYGVKYPEPQGSYEVDHFVSLELGGSNDIKNLWPEPATPIPGFHEKDKVEDYLHKEVCSGNMSLEEAQREIREDWYGVYKGINVTQNEDTVIMCGKQQKIKADTKEALKLAEKIIDIANSNNFPKEIRTQVGANWKTIEYNKKGNLNPICDDYLNNLSTDTLEIMTSYVQDHYGIRLNSINYALLNDGIYIESGFDGSLYGPIGR